MDAARAQGPEALKRWQDAYKPTPILAPLGGTVILRNVVVGQTVDLSTVLFALSDRLIVLAHVDEVDIGRIRPGLACRIVLDAYPDRPFPGRVIGVLYEGRTVSNVITYDVKVAPQDPPSFLRSQMTAVVHFILDRRESAVLVPAAALRRTDDGGAQVLVPGEDGQPVPRPVKTGLSNGDRTEILEGLAAGEAVLVSEKPYSPQRSQASSPLVMGPPSRSGGQTRGNRP
jgi:macrolide-specific efflux system membrane fusion protein